MSLPSATYRSIVRETYKSSVSPRATRNKAITLSFRALFEQRRQGAEQESFNRDMQDAVTFMRSQRTHKELLDRYNPLHDLTPEERVKATARRVGLDMPETIEKKGH